MDPLRIGWTLIDLETCYMQTVYDWEAVWRFLIHVYRLKGSYYYSIYIHGFKLTIEVLLNWFTKENHYAGMPSDPHLEGQTRILANQPAFSCSNFVLALMEWPTFWNFLFPILCTRGWSLRWNDPHLICVCQPWHPWILPLNCISPEELSEEQTISHRLLAITSF